MRIFKVTYLWVFGLLACIVACEEEDLPPEPRIEFEEYSIHHDQLGNDSALTLVISFKHGHAEMGLDSRHIEEAPFNEEPYNNNLFIEYEEKIDGEFQQVKQSSGPGPPPVDAPYVNFHSRFSDITPKGNNKAVRGKLERHIRDLHPLHSNTIRFRIWIVDRNLNESNKVETPAIEFNP